MHPGPSTRPIPSYSCCPSSSHPPSILAVHLAPKLGEASALLNVTTISKAMLSKAFGNVITQPRALGDPLDATTSSVGNGLTITASRLQEAVTTLCETESYRYDEEYLCPSSGEVPLHLIHRTSASSVQYANIYPRTHQMTV